MQVRANPPAVCADECAKEGLPTPFERFKSLCEVTERYAMDGEVNVTNLAALAPGSTMGAGGNFGEYLTQVKEQLLDSAAANVVPYDYAAEVLVSPEDAAEPPALLHIWLVSLQDGLVQLQVDVQSLFRDACNLSLCDMPIDMCESAPFDSWEARPYAAADMCVNEADEDVMLYYNKAKAEHDGEEQTTVVRMQYWGQTESDWYPVQDLCPAADAGLVKGPHCFLQPYESLPYDEASKPPHDTKVHLAR